MLLTEGLCELKITMTVTAIIIIAGNDSEDSYPQLISLSCNSRGPACDNRVVKAWEESQKPRAPAQLSGPVLWPGGSHSILPASQMTNIGRNRIS